MTQDLENRVSYIADAASTRNALYMERCWIEADADGFTGWRWDKYNVQMKIVCAANRYKDFIVTGSRHYCVSMIATIELIGEDALIAYAEDDYEQGFIDQWGTFHSRKQAAIIAVAAGQVKQEDVRGDTLFSEELY